MEVLHRILQALRTSSPSGPELLADLGDQVFHLLLEPLGRVATLVVLGFVLLGIALEVILVESGQRTVGQVGQSLADFPVFPCPERL